MELLANPLISLIALGVAAVLLGIWFATGKKNAALRITGGLAFLLGILSFAAGNVF